MASTELSQLQRSVRFAYEVGRLRRALLGVAPLVVLAALATAVTHRPMSAIGFGAAAIAVGTFLLWFGRDAQRAVLPGFVAGIAPLSLSLCANRVHVCSGGACTSLCIPACIVGGIAAGLAVATIGNRRDAGIWYWLCASALALLTGAMGCACIGYSGVIGLAIGFGAGVAPGLLRRAFGRG